MRHSLCILKPDCVKNGITEMVFSVLSQHGFRIVLERRLHFTRQEIEVVYARCRAQPFYEDLIKFMTSGDSVVLVVEHDEGDAIRKLNSLVGHTDPHHAKMGTIRKLGESVSHNLMHSTASEETFWVEARLLFSEEDLTIISSG